MSNPSIPQDVRERIIAVANDLYEQANRERFPTVDAVRRASRADMNAVSAVMKEWRQSQTVQAVPVAVAVPESILQAGVAAVSAVWQQATDLANQSLRTAQAAWESERAELDGMREELANGFEQQAQELETLKLLVAEHENTITGLRKVLDTQAQQEADAVARAETAEARNEEIEIRANDLHAELERAHLELERQRQDQVLLRNKLSMDAEAHAEALKQVTGTSEAIRSDLVKLQAKTDAQVDAHAEQRKQAAAELHKAMERISKLQADRDALQESATAARERAACLAGQLEATQTQNVALLAALKPQEQSQAPTVETAPVTQKPPRASKPRKTKS